MNQPRQQNMDLSRDEQSILLVALFASGAAALMAQLAWVRALSVTYGASSPAVATTVAVFMLGLGLGAHRGGRLAERSSNLFRSYAFIELLMN